MFVSGKNKLLGLIILMFACSANLAWSDELLIRHASLQRAGIPGIVQLPVGGSINTRTIHQKVYGTNFHPGDTLAWNNTTSQYVIHKRMTPTQVLAERSPRLKANQSVAAIAPGQSWFSAGASPAEMDEKGAVIFIGQFSTHSLPPRVIDSSSTSVFDKHKVSFSTQASSGLFDIGSLDNDCWSGLTDTDGDGDPDVTDPDDDNDGMTDDYENAHSVLDPLNKDDAGYDPDNDGLTNLEEFKISSLMDPDNPDTDFDGIQDNIDDDPPVYSNICSGFDAELADEAIIDRHQCAAAVSVTITGTVTIEPTGELEIISSTVTIDPVFNAKGQFRVISADPCPACPPLF